MKLNVVLNIVKNIINMIKISILFIVSIYTTGGLVINLPVVVYCNKNRTIRTNDLPTAFFYVTLQLR
jgi:hypothetical protein